jgi:hypothetical protein
MSPVDTGPARAANPAELSLAGGQLSPPPLRPPAPPPHLPGPLPPFRVLRARFQVQPQPGPGGARPASHGG